MDIQIPDQRLVSRGPRIDRYVVTLLNSRIPLRQRATAEKAAADLLRGQPGRDWLRHWYAATLAEIVSSLPTEDPWRNLDASLGSLRFWQVEDSIPEGVTGAWTLDGLAFGTWRNGVDLLPIPDMTMLDDASRDPSLATHYRPLDHREAGILGFAAHADVYGPDPLLRVLSDILDSDTNDMSDETIVSRAHDMLDAPLRWAVDRRMQYVGEGDKFVVHASARAKTYADREVLGFTSEHDADWDVETAWAGKIDDGMHDTICGVATLWR